VTFQCGAPHGHPHHENLVLDSETTFSTVDRAGNVRQKETPARVRAREALVVPPALWSLAQIDRVARMFLRPFREKQTIRKRRRATKRDIYARAREAS
jgi:hypothetical protein